MESSPSYINHPCVSKSQPTVPATLEWEDEYAESLAPPPSWLGDTIFSLLALGFVVIIMTFVLIVRL